MQLSELVNNRRLSADNTSNTIVGQQVFSERGIWGWGQILLNTTESSENVIIKQ